MTFFPQIQSLGNRILGKPYGVQIRMLCQRAEISYIIICDVQLSQIRKIFGEFHTGDFVLLDIQFLQIRKIL